MQRVVGADAEHAINSILTGTTARTALLTTAGHEDILSLREGGRLGDQGGLGNEQHGYLLKRVEG